MLHTRAKVLPIVSDSLFNNLCALVILEVMSSQIIVRILCWLISQLKCDVIGHLSHLNMIILAVKTVNSA